MSGTAAANARTYRGRAPDERRARRRAQLLEAGLDLLGEAGWRAATVTAICERARLTPRYFYESFSSRDDLLVAIFDNVIDDVTHEVLASSPADARATLRATAAAFMHMVVADPRKGRATFVEALGSEAMTRRRIDGMHRFADRLAHQAASPELREDQVRRLKAASLIAAGGLIELIIAWLEDELDTPVEQLIDDYTSVCAAGLDAAIGR